MIRGFFRVDRGRRRPFVTARLAIPSQAISGDVHFLVDSGADVTLLAPADVLFLRIDVGSLPQGTPTTGVGGTARTAYAEAAITLGHLTYDVPLRILLPGRRQQRALSRIPSLLGRDILSYFALFMEERSQRVMLLEPHEAASLRLP